MIRTVWLAIACLIAVAALTVIRVGTTSLEATGASDRTTGSSLISDASSSDPSSLGALAKGDRLDIRPIGAACSEQAWPNFEASCLRTAGTKTAVRAARPVAVDRVR